MTAIIVDDEILAQNALAELLQQHCPEVSIVAKAETGQEAIALVLKENPDLIFLDIELPDMLGFDVLQQLGNQLHAEVVFVTAHNDYAIRAFEFSALDYLVKPVDVSRLIQCVARAARTRQKEKAINQYQILMELMTNRDRLDHRIVFSTQTEIVFSWLRNLIRIDADANFSMVKLADTKDPLRIAKNIGEYEKLLGSYPHMMRIHRSHLINLFHVKRFVKEEDSVQMIDGFKIPVSSNRKEEVIERLASLGDIH